MSNVIEILDGFPNRAATVPARGRALQQQQQQQPEIIDLVNDDSPDNNNTEERDSDPPSQMLVSFRRRASAKTNSHDTEVIVLEEDDHGKPARSPLRRLLRSRRPLPPNTTPAAAAACAGVAAVAGAASLSIQPMARSKNQDPPGLNVRDETQYRELLRQTQERDRQQLRHQPPQKASRKDPPPNSNGSPVADTRNDVPLDGAPAVTQDGRTVRHREEVDPFDVMEVDLDEVWERKGVTPAARRRRRPAGEDEDAGVATPTAPSLPTKRPPTEQAMEHPPSKHHHNTHSPPILLDDDDEDDDPSDAVVRGNLMAATTNAATTTAATATAATVYYLDDSDVDDEEDDIHSVQALEEVEMSPELRVLHIIPDVDLQHVTTLLEQYKGDCVSVINHLLEQSNYPKSKTADGATSAFQQHGHVPAGTALGGAIIHRDRSTQQQWTYDFSSASSFKASKTYYLEAMTQLYSDFRWLSKKGASAFVNHYKHYAIVYDKIVTVLKGTTRDPVQQLNSYQAALTAKQLDASMLEQLLLLLPEGVRLKQLTKLPKRRSATPPPVTEVILQEEIRYAQGKVNEWVQAATVQRHRQDKQARVQMSGTGIECACCYDQYDIDDMVACRREGHLFCPDCLQRHASTKLFGEGTLGIHPKTKEPSFELLCFHPDSCDSPFDRSILVKALDQATLHKYDEIQAQLILRKANLTDMVTCPKCEYQAALAPSVRVYVCPVDDCRFASCRECGQAAHVPLRCEEVSKDAVETKGRVTVEEAISAAKIRRCPNCKQSFVKSEGCNKISCGCGAKVCYICQKLIQGYEHFCQQAHCTHQNCGKCRLHTNAEQDDALAMKEAGLQAAAEVKAQLASISTTDVNIDVESILRNPTAVRRA